MKEQAINIVKSWFNEVDDWQKDLFVNIWKGRNSEDSKDRALKLLYKKCEIMDNNLVPNLEIPNDINSNDSKKIQTILKEISNVKGVSALEPIKPLVLENGLNIIYGENGCGKSSYARILKKAENPKGDIKIHSNIYKSEQGIPKATLKFEEDGIIKEVNWNMSSVRVCPIKIYDSQIAKCFVEEANEIIYEPKLLSIFTVMALILEALSIEISKDIEIKTGKIVDINEELKDTKIIEEYLGLKDIKQIDKFSIETNVNDKELQELESINKNLADDNPQKTMQTLKVQIDFLEKLEKELEEITVTIGDSNVNRYLYLKKKKEEKKEEFDKYIEERQKIFSIQGFGSEEWKNMWNSAKEYAKIANEDKVFPNSTTNNKCVLCHQELSDKAVMDLKSFEEFDNSKISQEYEEIVEQCKGEFKEVEDLIEIRLNLESIEQKLIANALQEEIRTEVLDFFKKLYNRAKWIYENEKFSIEKMPTIYNISEIKSKFEEVIKVLENRVNSIEKFLKDYEGQLKRQKDLQAKCWIVDNKENLNIKKELLKLENAKSKCKTNSITTTKKLLSQVIITDAYIEKFKEELKAINPTNTIKVELVANGKKGRVYHQIRLRGAVENKKVEEILSEGEYRVVSIAAFLADLSSWGQNQVFVFDDPITSLDHKFEENVAKRLISLSTERQVIVFTHRLAFADLLNKNVDNLNYIELRRNPLGEPMRESKLGGTKLDQSLNQIKDQSIPLLKEAFKAGEYENYDLQLKGICSDIRKIVEKGIETELLSGVVSRYSCEVASRKIRYLKAIKDSDIDFLDSMMTKYSFQEHSSPTESSVALPELTEIETDIEKILKWSRDLKKRKKQYNS